MPKSFGSHCPVAKTLDIVGERWTLLIVRDLFFYGPRRFKDFEESLAGIAPNTLSARIKGLEEKDVIAKRLYTDHPPRAEYYLTDKGRALEPVLKTLLEWGKRYGG
ncbi:MAG: helix-turn-helix transcriptional regulator [Rhodospirillales bacterium]|nr:helix-turn-helix transcriptional regulator [Rhodospirillales bacterium]